MKLLKALGMVCVFLSTSPLRGTTVTQSYEIYFNGISIHVPLAGDDVPSASVVTVRCHFYPRPPCGGRRRRKFFSRSSRNFYPRPPCGGRHDRDAGSGQPGRISIHVPLAGDDLHARGGDGGTTRFLSTSPLRGTTFCWPPCSHLTPDFYPRPPCGGRLRHTTRLYHFIQFLSTSPLRGTTLVISMVAPASADFYPRPPCGGRLFHLCGMGEDSDFYPRPPCGGRRGPRLPRLDQLAISIHVPLAGDDLEGSAENRGGVDFYPRPPCGGRRGRQNGGGCGMIFLSTSPLRGTTCRICYGRVFDVFLSTSPLRGTTASTAPSMRTLTHFYPRPPCGGRPVGQAVRPHRADFYPRPPCGGRPGFLVFADIRQNFYPRPPCGGRPCTVTEVRNGEFISIHVPLAGDDLLKLHQKPTSKNFYPRPPCGGRPPTLADRVAALEISIHVPLAGDDRNPVCQDHEIGRFLSTSPLRGTTKKTLKAATRLEISIHVPLAGDDAQRLQISRPPSNFYPRPPCGGRPANVTENTVYFPAHLSQQDTAYKNTLRFCAGCGRFRGASARSALKMLCSPVRTTRRFSAR